MHDVRSRKGANIGIDHHLEAGEIKFKCKRFYTKKVKPEYIYNVMFLKDPETTKNKKKKKKPEIRYDFQFH